MLCHGAASAIIEDREVGDGAVLFRPTHSEVRKAKEEGTPLPRPAIRAALSLGADPTGLLALFPAPVSQVLAFLFETH